MSSSSMGAAAEGEQAGLAKLAELNINELTSASFDDPLTGKAS